MPQLSSQLERTRLRWFLAGDWQPLLIIACDGWANINICGLIPLWCQCSKVCPPIENCSSESLVGVCPLSEGTVCFSAFAWLLKASDNRQEYLLSITLSKDLIWLLSFDAVSRTERAPLGQPSFEVQSSASLSVSAVHHGNYNLASALLLIAGDQWEAPPRWADQWETDWGGSERLSCGISPGGLCRLCLTVCAWSTCESAHPFICVDDKAGPLSLDRKLEDKHCWADWVCLSHTTPPASLPLFGLPII